MGKVLFWIVLIIAVLLIARIVARHKQNSEIDNDQPKQAKKRGAPPVEHAENMVRCAHCGIHMPRSEAVLSGGNTWCSADHAKLGVRQ